MPQDDMRVFELKSDGRLTKELINEVGDEYSFVKPDDYKGISLYWGPTDIHVVRRRLKELGFKIKLCVLLTFWQGFALLAKVAKMLQLSCNS